MRQEYNDNIFFTSSDEVHDAVTTVSPGLELAGRTERLDARLFGGLEKRWYSDNSELEQTDYEVFGNVRYRLSPRLSVAGDIGYLEDSRPDRDIETTGILLGIEERRRFSASGSGEYELTELMRTTFSYSFYDTDWENPSLNDSVAHSVNLGLVRSLESWFPNTWGRFNAGYSHYEYSAEQSFTGTVLIPFPPFPPIPTTQDTSISQDTTTDYYSLTVGVQHRLSETYSLLFDAGAGYVNTEENTVRTDAFPFFPGFDQTLSADRTTDTWSGIGTLELSYQGERTDMAVRARHDIGSPSGDVGATARTSFAMDVRRRFTYELHGNLALSYFINKADREELLERDTDQQTFNVTPRLRYDIGPDLYLEALYRYSWQEDRIAGTQSTRSLIYGGVRAGWNLLE